LVNSDEKSKPTRSVPLAPPPLAPLHAANTIAEAPTKTTHNIALRECMRKCITLRLLAVTGHPLKASRPKYDTTVRCAAVLFATIQIRHISGGE
jgi:hypothetical protein